MLVLVIQPVVSVYVMFAVPAATAFSKPVELLMVATAVVPLVHVPPDGVEEKVVVDPLHTTVEPAVMLPGKLLTVSTAYASQPVDGVKVMLVVPAVRPVTKPEVEPMVATAVLLLVHDTPLPAVLERVVVLP
jgi:hypothetical protein